MATKAKNVYVYVRADDVRMLERTNRDPADWVRGLVRWALDKEHEKEKKP